MNVVPDNLWLIPVMAFTIVPIAVLLLAVVVQILADIFG